MAPEADWEDRWESLLHRTLADAVIVSNRSGSEDHVDQLRKLTQSAIPLIIIQPCCESIVGFELEMIRQDTGGVVMPCIPGRFHPGIAYLGDVVRGVDGSPIGDVEQIVLQRSMSSRQRGAVLSQLTRDAGLLRALVGDLSRVTATGPNPEDQQLTGLSVSISCGPGIPIRWSVEAGDDEGQLTVVGSSGRIIFQLADDIAAWTMTRVSSSGPEAVPLEPYDDASVQLAIFLETIESGSERLTWVDSCRDAEVADSVQYSLKRGRRVDLTTEAPTEEGSFKGVMSVGGCSILLLAMFGLLVFAVVEGFRYTGQRRAWEQQRQELAKRGLPPQEFVVDRGNLLLRLWPVYPLILFLLLQLLRLVIKHPSGNPRHTPRE